MAEIDFENMIEELGKDCLIAERNTCITATNSVLEDIKELDTQLPAKQLKKENETVQSWHEKLIKPLNLKMDFIAWKEETTAKVVIMEEKKRTKEAVMEQKQEWFLCRIIRNKSKNIYWAILWFLNRKKIAELEANEQEEAEIEETAEIAQDQTETIPSTDVTTVPGTADNEDVANAEASDGGADSEADKQKPFSWYGKRN